MDIHLPLKIEDLERLIASKYTVSDRKLAALLRLLSLLHDKAGPSMCFELTNAKIAKLLNIKHISCTLGHKHRPLAVLESLGLIVKARPQSGTAKGIWCLTYPELAFYTYRDC